MSKNTNLSFLTDYITADITNGRIGINTPSPTVAFDVTGVAKFSSSIYGARALFDSDFLQNETSKVGISFGGGYGQINSWGANTSTYGGLKFQLSVSNGATVTPLTIVPTGQVGIGKTPRTGFGINLDVSGGIQLTNDSANISYLAFGQNSNPQLSYTYIGGDARSTGFMNFFTNDTERMRITSNGNVVIGSTIEDALYKVRIVGGLLATNNTTNYAITFQNTSFSAGAHTLFVDAYSSSSSTNALFVRVNDGNTTAMVVKGSGNTLLGTGSDNGERLYVSGSIRATGSITANSDISLKKNLLKIENALEKVEQINGYTYEFKEDDSKRHAGVIAQEIQKVLPEIVNKGDNGILGVEYGNMSALLIEAIKELSKEINLLKNK